jgi:hypothetical protein
MLQELKPDEFEKVRSLFQGFEYSLSIKLPLRVIIQVGYLPMMFPIHAQLSHSP